MVPLSDTVEQGKRLKQVRQMTLLSRRSFAKKYSFHISSLQAWEEGRYKKGISLQAAETIQSAYRLENINFSTEWLIYGVGGQPHRQPIHQQQVKHYTKDSLLANLENGLAIRIKNFQMIQAIKNNNADQIKKLVLQGANLHKLKFKELYLYSNREDTALHFAAAYGKKELVKLFITLGVHPNIRNRHLDTPLHTACLENNRGAVEALVEFNANIESGSREGATPLIWSAYLGNTQMCGILLSAGANIHNTDNYGNTVMHWAAFNNQADMLKYLYARGGDPWAKNHEHKTPIDWAVENGYKDSLVCLMSICDIQ